MKRFLISCLTVVAILGTTGCVLSDESIDSLKQTGIILIKSIPFSEAAEGTVNIPVVPKLETIVTVDASTIELAIKAHWWNAQISPFPDETYALPTHESMLNLLEWAATMRELLPVGDNGKTFQAETADCDNFAQWLTFAANMAAAQGKAKGQPLVGRMWVTQASEFGGVPAGGVHALNWWVDEHGLWVIEPQSGVYVHAATFEHHVFGPPDIISTGLYPNYDHVTHIFCD